MKRMCTDYYLGVLFLRRDLRTYGDDRHPFTAPDTVSIVLCSHKLRVQTDAGFDKNYHNDNGERGKNNEDDEETEEQQQTEL